MHIYNHLDTLRHMYAPLAMLIFRETHLEINAHLYLPRYTYLDAPRHARTYLDMNTHLAMLRYT